jgi:hypothetical protein
MDTLVLDELLKKEIAIQRRQLQPKEGPLFVETGPLSKSDMVKECTVAHIKVAYYQSCELLGCEFHELIIVSFIKVG